MHLKRWFRKKRIGSSTTGLSACLTYASAQAAPAGLMTSILESALTVQTVSTLSSNFILNGLLFMKTKTILITGIGIVAITGLVLLDRNDATPKPLTDSKGKANQPSLDETNSTEATTTPIMQRVGQLQSARIPSLEGPDLISQFRSLLHSDEDLPDGSEDPAWTFLSNIPVGEREPYWALINEAMDATLLSVQVRATRLLPLIWPQHIEALPKLYDRLR